MEERYLFTSFDEVSKDSASFISKSLFLNISPLEITYLTGTIFYRLVCLEMYTCENEWWNLLTPMLENSPKLQVLKLVDYLSYYKDGVVGVKWNEPKCVPECLLSHLETFVWKRYNWGKEKEKKVATYILKNARLLKNATFTTSPVESEELNNLEKRRKRLNELDGVRLSITDYISGIENGSYVINAPSLKYLKLKGFSHRERCLIENAPVLVEAKIRQVSYIANEKIMGSLKLVEHLSLELSPLEIKYPTGSIFYRLVHLKMYTSKAEWWNLLTIMLDSSPKLQVLELSDPFRELRKYKVVGGKWNQPKNVPDCLLSHLKMFVWTRYHWEREEDREVATYILKNAKQLKNATFTTRPIHFSEPKKSEDRCNMLNELDGVVSTLIKIRDSSWYRVLSILIYFPFVFNKFHVCYRGYV
ncbi:hypothetical protein AALP_AA5G155900 [Arabis alpina]|uniref:FBD domain-containing protein n=1 Tax=Arabis alpina TaxID=50452 RepID=A0A087GXB5_ARAAL|nr:hypothetical protein AALP_AA5G155900 [Arabis alpina]